MMMRVTSSLTIAGCVLAALATAALAQRPQPKEVGDAPELYPDAPHREDTFYACTACHSFKIVAQQGMSRDRWDESLTWMVQRHAMPPVEGRERQQVLDYLSAAFPERRQPGGWKNPFAPP
jgi:hypothetical protein